ncbi:hypothetical protein DICSQDRAFT_168993 [Dichomitus squalens LYAD-421 SS1]|uniref:uncharacterized protein n=1 Tax=Dichomitus squalens (strain LYAD-421) TaxID=732165 RepID=UPI0004414A82|nr:uncharacterized protein DICSQDRAFT_168993 [Dichomitus squalens LYAD-421 SS1]EJF62601.1 hypothetical protein DICSQDRAFT_168993 [Dichomitus squalens LYAD-421 SS1]
MAVPVRAACSHNWYDEPIRKHTIQDDMESMLYVILYCGPVCGILYLPHYTPDMHMKRALETMFDYYSEVPGAEFPDGGVHKDANIQYRKYTQCLAWHSSDFKSWLGGAPFTRTTTYGNFPTIVSQ